MQILIKIYIYFIVFLFSSYAYLFFFQHGMSPVKPLHWQLFTISMTLFIMALRSRNEAVKFSRYLLIWLMLFLSSSIISYIYSPQGDVEKQALIESFRAVLLLFSLFYIFTLDDAVRVSRIALLSVVLLSVPMNLIDFVMPTWSKVSGRAAGLYVNPTISGAMLVLAMVLSIPVVVRNMRVIYCLFVGVGVFITFSRGPWLFWVIAITGLGYIGAFDISRRMRPLIFPALSLLAGALVFAMLTGGAVGFFTMTGLDSYLTPGTLARIGGSGAAFTDYSTTTRADVVAKAWDVLADNPLFGAGLGVDKNWVIGTHNTYLRMASEGGLIRLAIFIGLLVVLWRTTDDVGRVALAVYSASCLTSHNNLQAPAFILVIALIAISNNKAINYSESEQLYVNNR